jgi:hypothetical protein
MLLVINHATVKNLIYQHQNKICFYNFLFLLLFLISAIEEILLEI